jgi:ATP-dependent RNA helicase DDX46/PRP5
MSSTDSEGSFVHKKRHKEKKHKRERSRSPSRSRDRKDRKEKKRRRHDSKSSSSSSRKNKNKNKKREDRKRKHEIEDLKDREIQRRQQMESKRKIEEDQKKKQKQKEESHPKEQLTEEEKLKRKKQSRFAKAIAVALLDSVDEKKKENEVLKNDEMEDFLQIKNEQKTKDILVDELENFEDIALPIESPQLPQVTFNFMNKKMPQLPKEFLKTKTDVKPTMSIKLTDNEDEEDPLDLYMKTIEKEAVIQDYELVQMLNRQELQRQYDEIAEKQDTVIMIDRNINKPKEAEESEVSESLPMIVTLDDLLQTKTIGEEEDDDEFHRKFIESLKGTKVPEYDPILGYTYIQEEKKENIIYQEDVNEFRKEEDFVEMEEAWRNAKKSGEKGKELKLVNHAEINYEPFRKDFYKESKEIAMMTEEEVLNFRKENGEIKIRGKNTPKPISNWYQCGFYEKILAVLEKKGYKTPFPIQAQAVPCIMSGRDVIGIAETGSGKTLAYVLPMLRHVLDQRRLREGEGPISIMFAPTRELATQIYSVVKGFAKILNLRVSCVYGGSGIGPQVSELRRGAEIVVCTPGRMIEILCMNNGKVTNLQRVRIV